jgi:ABC-type uncharacterized transport system involved in gliding motility auxiliary subunit
MKPQTDPRHFAPIGLVIAGIALLVSLGALVVKAFIAAGLYFVLEPASIDRVLYIALAGIPFGFAIYALLDPEKTREIITGRQAQYGSNALILLVAVGGILIFTNILAQQNPRTWDMTADKLNTLAPETQETLAAMPAPVHATALFTSNYPRATAEQLLQALQVASNGKFTYEFVDPDLNPLAVRALGLSETSVSDGSVVLTMNNQNEVVGFVQEQDITSALVRLLNPAARAVYFLTGHGEQDINDPSELGYSAVRQALESKNYSVQTLNLAAQGTIPADALAIIIAGPTQAISQAESQLLMGYLANGGGLVLLVEPVALTEVGTDDPLLKSIAQFWSISAANDIVIDLRATDNLFNAIAFEYAPHPITDKLSRFITVYPNARSLEVGTPPSNIRVFPLVRTSADSWSEREFSLENQNPQFDPATDVQGPLTLALAAEDTINRSRLVIIGDSDFAINQLFATGANGKMILNSIDWTARQDELINLTPKNATERTFILPDGNLQLLTLVFVLCIFPLAILAAGFAAWMTRRRRG